MPTSDEQAQLLASELIGPTALDPKVVPLSALMIVEYLDEDGTVSLHYRRSSDTSVWKAIGMCKTIETLLLDIAAASEVFDDTDEPAFEVELDSDIDEPDDE